MNNRERILSVLNYENYDRLPIVHFGFLRPTLMRWADEGHISREDVTSICDGSPAEVRLSEKLGFDCNYYSAFTPDTGLYPLFERKVIEEMPNGYRKVFTAYGTTILDCDDNESINAEIDHLLKDRKAWDEEFKHRFAYSDDRLNTALVNVGPENKPFSDGGKEYLMQEDRDTHILLHCGSLYGKLRDYVGIENLCYMLADDEELLDEMIQVNADLSYQCTEAALASGVKWDIAHFWEDIAYKNGPLVNPNVFAEKVGPHYKRIAQLLNSHGIELISLDCDGLIDSLIPTWLENGVNVMFPIEVGTWHASIKPWREKYGKELRGVGGMDKKIFAKDYAAVDGEIERLKSLVEMEGYLPCPDHRIANDAKWENVQYYCDKMKSVFG